MNPSFYTHKNRKTHRLGFSPAIFLVRKIFPTFRDQSSVSKFCDQQRLPLVDAICGQVIYIWLVVSTHLKNISKHGNLPQLGVKIKNIWNHHLDIYYCQPPVTNIKKYHHLVEVWRFLKFSSLFLPCDFCLRWWFLTSTTSDGLGDCGAPNIFGGNTSAGVWTLNGFLVVEDGHQPNIGVYTIYIPLQGFLMIPH